MCNVHMLAIDILRYKIYSCGLLHASLYVYMKTVYVPAIIAHRFVLNSSGSLELWKIWDFNESNTRRKDY